MEYNEASKNKKRSVKILIVVLVSILSLCILWVAINLGLMFSKFYNGERLLRDGEYEQAIEVFRELPENSFTDLKIRSAYYGIGENYYSESEYENAIAYFEKAEGYGGSDEYISSCYYNLGITAQIDNDYNKAIEYYTLAGGYEKSVEKISECHYALATSYIEEKEFDKARESFGAAGEYKDAPQKLISCDYYEGHSLFVEGKYDEAAPLLDKAVEIADALEEYHPHFRTLVEAEDYLRQQADNLSDEIIICIGQLPMETVSESELLQLVYNYVPMGGAHVSFSEEEKLLTVHPKYYPGHRILYYHRMGKENILSETEMQAYNKALSIVDQAKAETASELELELWIHDWICNNTVYEDKDPLTAEDRTFLNCMGVLHDGKANCQGYSDAFYLLASLAGFEVRIVGGETHAWNAVKLKDKWYVVDTTFNDIADSTSTAKQYIWFNVEHGTEEHEPVGTVELFPWMFTEKDYSMSYYNFYDRMFSDVYEAADSLARQNVYEGQTWTYVMIEGAEVQKNTFSRALRSVLDRYYTGYITWYEYYHYVDGNTYFTVYWTN